MSVTTTCCDTEVCGLQLSPGFVVDTSWCGLNELTVLLTFLSTCVRSALMGQMFCLGSDSMDYLQLAKFFKGSNKWHSTKKQRRLVK